MSLLIVHEYSLNVVLSFQSIWVIIISLFYTIPYDLLKFKYDVYNTSIIIRFMVESLKKNNRERSMCAWV